MKLLDWMHRKFRQNNNEPLKEFVIGQPSLDDLQYYPKSNHHIRHSNKTQRDNQLRKSFACLESARAEAEYLEDESSAEFSELFHGFLAIGTLGTDPIVSDPSTPTFAFSVEDIMEKETEATENELRLINDELEKVLGAAEADGYTDSSGRNSYVSMGRSSHGSTITLGGKPLEAAVNNENGTVACPLQGYLFGSAIGLPETTMGKKEHRTSLGELFQKTKMTEENAGPKCTKGEKRTEKETDKSTLPLMKKILKRRMLQSSTGASGGTTDSTSSEKKAHKILHMFHRKVHPERSTVTEKSQNASKYEIKSNYTYEERYKNGNQIAPCEDITVIPQRTISKKDAKQINNQFNLHHVMLSANDSNGNRECWIKSDADYLVLEL